MNIYFYDFILIKLIEERRSYNLNPKHIILGKAKNIIFIPNGEIFFYMVTIWKDV